MAPAFFSIALALLGSSTQPATWPHPLRLPGGGLTFDRVVRHGEPPEQDRGSGFQVVDELLVQDDFWSNMLVGNADHDRGQEIVIRSGKKFIFYEDDGTGQFDLVHDIPEPDGGLLAMGDIDGDGLTDLFFERALGFCNHQFVRMEASSHFGFPDHVVWTAEKQGNVVDFHATIADVDGDGVREFVTSDNNFNCLPTTLKVFESAPGDQMKLIYSKPAPSDLGNPLVADFDLDGRNEIVVAEGQGGRLHVLEGIADDTIVYTGVLPHPMFNSYQLALVDAFSPDNRPIAFFAGQMGGVDYRVQSYEMLADNVLSQVNETPLPNNCGASIAQIAAADLFGTPTAEIFVDRLCDPVPIYSVHVGGALVLFDLPVINESIEITGTRKTRVHSGAIAVGRFSELTAVLELVDVIP
jgi:hypothetical protein